MALPGTRFFGTCGSQMRKGPRGLAGLRGGENTPGDLIDRSLFLVHIFWNCPNVSKLDARTEGIFLDLWR